MLKAHMLKIGLSCSNILDDDLFCVNDDFFVSGSVSVIVESGHNKCGHGKRGKLKRTGHDKHGKPKPSGHGKPKPSAGHGKSKSSKSARRRNSSSVVCIQKSTTPSELNPSRWCVNINSFLERWVGGFHLVTHADMYVCNVCMYV